jgi:hypothetical protein
LILLYGSQSRQLTYEQTLHYYGVNYHAPIHHIPLPSPPHSPPKPSHQPSTPSVADSSQTAHPHKDTNTEFTAIPSTVDLGLAPPSIPDTAQHGDSPKILGFKEEGGQLKVLFEPESLKRYREVHGIPESVTAGLAVEVEDLGDRLKDSTIEDANNHKEQANIVPLPVPFSPTASTEIRHSHNGRVPSGVSEQYGQITPPPSMTHLHHTRYLNQVDPSHPVHHRRQVDTQIAQQWLSPSRGQNQGPGYDRGRRRDPQREDSRIGGMGNQGGSGTWDVQQRARGMHET